MTKKRETNNAEQSENKRPKKFFVRIERDPDVQKARLELPVCLHEQEIIEAIHANDVVLITGATGTGKTTQVPQFLVEDGFGDFLSPSSKGIIAVTQPRRVAAVSCSKRVAFEMNSKVGSVVGYQIRHDSRIGADTKVKFVTDGVLLREVERDILLRKYSAIIIDEVHERSLNTDLLLSFLSRSVLLRKGKESTLGRLKVIIMSATLDVEGVFSGDNALFPNSPVVKVPSRQYPVTTHFAQKTKDNYVEEAYKKVSKIHSRLPPGGVLVFLSGRHEVEELCRQLSEKFEGRLITIEESDGQKIGMKVLPFYALLPDQKQRLVFDDYGDDVRKVVVATNVAETSVTVPGVAYVVDSGRVKEKIFKGSSSSLLSSFEVRWVSQASAEQRMGRAGRTGPGHCYRLYSSAVYDQQFESFREPEVLRVPADSIVLRLRAMGILHVHKFPFPTKPNEGEVTAAEKLLVDLGALFSKDKIPSLKLSGRAESSVSENSYLGVTRIGRALASLPVPPRFGRMLLSAKEGIDALPYACRIAAILTVGTVLDKSTDDFKAKQTLLRNRRSDLMTELAAVCAVEHTGREGRNNGRSNSKKLNIPAMRTLCQHLSLHLKSIVEVISISRQLENVFLKDGEALSSLQPPTNAVERHIFRSFLSGFPDQVARRMSRREAAAMGVIPKRQKLAFTVPGRDEPVFLESSSSVRLDTDVEFVCYSDLVEIQRTKFKQAKEEDVDDYEESEDEVATDGNERKSNIEGSDDMDESVPAGKTMSERRVIMRGATVVRPEWVIEEATSMCHFTPKSGLVEAEYDAKAETVVESIPASYGRHHWPLGKARVPVGLLPLLTKDKDRDEDRMKVHCEIFARAVLTGKIQKDLTVPFKKSSIASFAICVRSVGDMFAKYSVVCVAELKMLLRDKEDILSGIIGAFKGQLQPNAESSWRSAIRELTARDDEFHSDEWNMHDDDEEW